MMEGPMPIPAFPLMEPEVGFVIIGRNEGKRLALSIDSVLRETGVAVYVDSGSIDDSVALARDQGLPVVELSRDIPFTAARARNAGFRWLEREYPAIRFVHFIDGDCELVPGWLEAALRAIRADPGLAAVCGRRRERAPEVSPYNRLCDFEWNTPVGFADTVGGDALFRVEPLHAVNGFAEDLIAGEEPDLCHRIRGKGWRILRMEGDMTVHDAAMTRFTQWWQRNRRNGYAVAESLVRRGNRRILREVVSNVIWAMPPAWLLWPVLWTKIWVRRGAMQASYMTIAKLPHFQGHCDYWRKRKRLIEYK